MLREGDLGYLLVEQDSRRQAAVPPNPPPPFDKFRAPPIHPSTHWCNTRPGMCDRDRLHSIYRKAHCARQSLNTYWVIFDYVHD
jgi:hypothetical protein